MVFECVNVFDYLRYTAHYIHIPYYGHGPHCYVHKVLLDMTFLTGMDLCMYITTVICYILLIIEIKVKLECAIGIVVGLLWVDSSVIL